MNEALELTGSVVSEIEDLARRANSEAGVVEIEGTHYSAIELHDATPKLHEPYSLNVHTLTGLIGYLEVNRDKIEPEEVVLHVGSESSVEVVSGIKGPRNQRFVYAKAYATPIVDLTELGWVAPDDMTIADGDLLGEAVVLLPAGRSGQYRACLSDPAATRSGARRPAEGDRREGAERRVGDRPPRPHEMKSSHSNE